MKKVLLFILLIAGVACISCNRNSNDKKQTVNPIIGDFSFIQKFGHEPSPGTDEDLRIRTHFEYVVNILRQKNIAGLSPELRQKREHLLDLLHTYWTTGIFPRNYDYKKDREPCFIDKDKRICAVGYLIEKTTSRQIAENINSKHKYDEVLEMNDDMVDDWIATSGLSKEECAMIQPSYGAPPSNNYISNGYGIGSAVLGGLNLSLNTINGIQISKGTNKKTIAIVGIITGAGQAVWGVAKIPKDANGRYGNYTNESQKTLSMVNIALGTTTMILSTWNLLTNKKITDKKTTWNLNSFETQGDIGVAFTIRRRL